MVDSIKIDGLKQTRLMQENKQVLDDLRLKFVYQSFHWSKDCNFYQKVVRTLL